MSMDESHEYRELLVRQLEKFRLQKGVSQRDMSLSIGQSEGYVARLTNPKVYNMPRMINFFYICDYFGVHPKDFFDESVEHPDKINALIKNLYKLSDTQLEHVSAVVQVLTELAGGK